MNRLKEELLNSDIESAKQNYENVQLQYEGIFCSIYGFDLIDAYWPSNRVLSVADYFFGLFDIMYAVNNKIDSDTLFEWYDYNLTLGNYFLGDVSLENYSKGILPYDKEDVKRLSELQSEFTKAKFAMDDLLVKMKKDKAEQNLI